MEDRANQARGYKAAMNNPRNSDEARQHAKDMLEDEYDDVGDFEDQVPDNQRKNPGNVAGGLKAAMHNPQVSKEGKQRAEDKLNQM